MDYIRVEHKLHSTSYSFHKSCFLSYLYSMGTQHGNLHQAGRPVLLCGPTQEPVLATANTGKKSGEVLEKKGG